MRRPVFADPKTDFAFHRIFGDEKHKVALIGFLNDILELDGAHRVTDVKVLDPEQRPKVIELKNSIVDVKCVDARGVQYVVEMQVLNVEAFEKRIVYNVAKAYTSQLKAGDGYPELNDIVGITICDFELWPKSKGFDVPMASRWKMQEQSTGQRGLLALQFVFLELPKYNRAGPPQTMVERWAYFFREADNLDVVPEELHHPQLIEAFEAARTAAFTTQDWDAYINAGMAIQNERGMLSLAKKEGHKEGHKEGLEEGLDRGEKRGRQIELRRAVRDMCELLSIELSSERDAAIEALDVEGLAELRDRIKQTKGWPGAS